MMMSLPTYCMGLEEQIKHKGKVHSSRHGALRSLTCWSLHTEATLLRLLLLMPTGCPMGGNELTPPEPPAMETVMLMLL